MKTKLYLKIILAFLMLLMPFTSFAQIVWTVETVPNTRLKGKSIHVSDPDDLISDSCEMKINKALCTIQDEADVFLVVLNSIGNTSIETFASDLFNVWGIGDAETNNGVLMLLVKDSRKFRIEVGYGVEDVLTDYRCYEITEGHIIPYLKNYDFEGGLLSGVSEMMIVFGGTVPDGFVPAQPIDFENNDNSDKWISRISLGIIVLPLIFLFIFVPIRKRRKGSSYSSSGSYHSSDDDYDYSSDDDDDDDYSSDDDDSGSFGGGSSGGGGYTGSW